MADTQQNEENQFGGVPVGENQFGGIPQNLEIFAAPEPKKFFRTSPSGQRVPRGPTRRERAEEIGLSNLDTAQGGNTAARLASSLGDIDDVRRQLGEQFNVPPEEIDLGNFEGLGIVFKNPKTGEFELLDSIGLDPADFAVAGVEAPLIAAEVGGAIAGGLKGGPLGAAGGASAAAAAARAIQLTILEQTGILTLEEGEILKRSSVDAAVAGAAFGAPTLGRVIKGVFSPNLRALNKLGKAGVTSEGLAAGRAELAPLEKATGAEFSAGQRLSQVDPVAGGRLRATELSHQATTGELERKAAQEAAETKFKQKLISGSADPIILGREISDIARQNYLRRVDEVFDATIQQTKKIEARLAEVAGVGGATGGANIRQILLDGRDEVFETLSKQYDELWAKVPASARVDMSGLKKVAVKWRGRLNEDIFPSLTPEDLTLVKDALKSAATPNGKSFASTSRALSLLKGELRAIGTPTSGAGIRQKKLLGDLIDELETAREVALKSIDPILATEIRTQDALWREAKQKIDDSLVGAILARKTGTSVFKVADDQVFRNIVRSEANLRDYLKAVEDFPQLNAIDDIKRSFDGLYTDQVVEGTIRHETWVARNRRSLELVYSPEEMKRFQNAGRLQDEIKFIQKNEQKLLADLKGAENKENGFIYKLGTYFPEEAVRVTKGSPAKARLMVELLEKHPDKLKAFRDVRVTQLIEDAGANPGTIRKALTGDSRRELEVILGEEYVQNLDDLIRLIEVQATPSTQSLVTSLGTVETPGSVYGGARKLIFGPLSRTGYRIRIFGRFFPVASDDAMMRLMRDPDKLETLLRVNEMRVSNKVYWNYLIGTLGITVHDITNILENERLGPEQSREQLLQFIKNSE